MGLLNSLEEKERLLRQMQHQLERLLRWRYGPRRERVDENQLFLFAAALVHSGQEAALGSGLLAQVALSKYGDHLPLYREDEIYQRQGVEPSRTRTGRIWTYVGGLAHPYTVYEYTPTRSRDGPQAFLEEFRGIPQADAYADCDQLYEDPPRGVVEVACWARGALWARQKFYQVAQTSDLMRATVLLAYIGLLYDVGRGAHQQYPRGEGRRAVRQAGSKPVLEDIHADLAVERPQVLPRGVGSAKPSAIRYRTGKRCWATWKTAIWRSITTAPSVACAASRSAARTGSSSAAITAGAPPP